MFASFSLGVDRDWQPSDEQWAELRAIEGADEFPEFEFPQPYDGEPGAVSALLLESTDISSLDDAAVIDSMKGFGRLASWAQAIQSAVIAEFARRRPPEWVGEDVVTVDRYATEEIACALSLTVRGAGNRLELAQRLAGALPATRAAWELGVLDWPRVTVIAERTAVLPVEQARQVEQEILPKVGNKTTGQIRRVVDRAVISADPDAAASRHAAARQQRDVTVRPIEDGMALLTAVLDIEEAAAAERVLNALAAQGGTGRADAFMRLVTGDATPVPTRKHLVQVIVPASTLAGIDDQPAEVPGWGVIPADAARRIATDATWQRILTDPVAGAILDVGRKRYRPPKAVATTFGSEIGSAYFRRAANPPNAATWTTADPTATAVRPARTTSKPYVRNTTNSNTTTAEPSTNTRTAPPNGPHPPDTHI